MYLPKFMCLSGVQFKHVSVCEALGVSALNLEQQSQSLPVALEFRLFPSPFHARSSSEFFFTSVFKCPIFSDQQIRAAEGAAVVWLLPWTQVTASALALLPLPVGWPGAALTHVGNTWDDMPVPGFCLGLLERHVEVRLPCGHQA